MPSPVLGLTDLRIRQQHAYGDVPAVTVDAALGLYAVVERSRDVIVLALDDGHELARLPGLANRQCFRRADLGFSPDGELVAINYITFGGQALLRILHLGGGSWSGACRAGVAWHSRPTAVAWRLVRRKGESPSGTHASDGWFITCPWAFLLIVWPLIPPAGGWR